jgi:crotonobetainyl-CoA:carnitine CoA-transferase CaiB-like acyl-CoA transferase
MVFRTERRAAPKNGTMNKPVRIVDLSSNPMGGYATRLLAAYGAEVVKVEPPRTGEPTRSVGPFPDDQPHPDRGGTSLFLDANKKSVTLDIARPRGREIFDRLLETADVMVETFAPARADQLGLGYSELERRFPRLIVASITPFGKDGPYRDFQACDIVLEAMSGWLFQSGEPDRAPTRTRGEIFHLLQGMRVPAGYLTTAEEVLALEQLRAREAFVSVNHPEAGSLEFPGAPFKMEAPRFQNGRAPLLGEHNEQVFAHGLGISGETLAALRAEGII